MEDDTNERRPNESSQGGQSQVTPPRLAPEGKLIWTFLFLLILCLLFIGALYLLQDGLLARVSWKHWVLIPAGVYGIAIVLTLQFFASGKFLFHRLGLELCVVTLGAAVSGFALWTVASQENTACPEENTACKQSFTKAQAVLPGLYEAEWLKLEDSEASEVQELNKLEGGLFGGVAAFALGGTLISALVVRAIDRKRIQKPRSYTAFTVIWGILAFIAYLALLVLGIEG